MMFSGLVEFSNDVFSKTIIADGKTLRLVHNIAGQPQEYVDDSGNVYYSEDNGKTVYKKD